jgi:hypothetical protein
VTLLVDSPRLHSAIATAGLPVRSRKSAWCHLVSTIGEDELHEFAARLGMKRSWAQLRPGASQAHYDLVPTRRALAVRLGAIEVAGRDLVRLNYDGAARRGLLGDPAKQAAEAEARALIVAELARRTDPTKP